MIAIKNLTFGYRPEQPVLHNLNLEASAGRIYGLLGRNGSGKSSLLHVIGGLLFPHSGTCTVANNKPSEREPAFLQQMYLLPEEVYVPNVNIKSYLDINAPFYPCFNFELFENIIKEFEIPTRNKLQGMSYGQRKKVMISFALATRAKVLLLDEPTNGLDIPSKKQFRKIIAGTSLDEQVLIISTHQVRDLDSLIDHVLILEQKQIIINESVDRITEKLVFKQVMSLDEVSNPFYSEGGLKGHAIVAANSKNEQSKLDMEIFFNAVLADQKMMSAHLND
jgi:ABC-2 type transport system ATP-binding protein